MSIGNTKTDGNKGNNFPWQLAVLELLGTISANTAIPAGSDYELITSTYEANKNGVGYSTGDTITRTQIVLVPTGTIVSTLWFNQSTGLSIAAPPIADIDPVAPATSVTVNNLPLVLGQATMANSLAVAIASDQSSIPVTGPFLTDTQLRATPVPVSGPLTDTQLRASAVPVSLGSVPLPTGAATEATLALVKAKTDNLDVALSTRATETTLGTRLADATFTTRINTLGQKAMAASTPVVLASDQTSIPVTMATSPLPAGAATEATLLLVKAKTDNLDVALSTRATEATLVLIKTNTDNLDVALSTRSTEATQLLIKAKTDNLDVTLSTRATEATLATRASEATLATMLTLAGFQARINTLGQKTMAASTPVVISSDQSNLPIRPLVQTTDAVAIYGSDDGGTTKRIIKTDAGGAIQVDLEIANVTVDNLGGAAAVNIQDGGNSITIDATSLPLPTGAATAALQTQPGIDIGDVTVNNAAGVAAVNIQDGGNSITVDGSVSIAGSVAVTGPLTDAQLRASAVPVSLAAVPLPTGAATEVTLAAINTKTPALGQATMVNSQPVVIASNQSTIPVSLASQPLPTGASTSALQTTLNTQVGIVTETAPATDTASSGLNGRLQRIAQRLTSLIALLPTSIGQKTSAASLAVVLASDQPAIPVTLPAASRTPSLVLVPAGTGATNTTAGVKEVSLKVDGNNGTIGGVAVPNGTVVTFRAPQGDTVAAISYATGAGTTILISYLT